MQTSAELYSRLGHRRPIRAGIKAVVNRRGMGFSLVELVMVVAIISTIAGVGVSRWARATQHYQVDLAAQRIAADIAVAQQRANISSSSVTIIFNAGSTYQIVGMPDRDRPGQTYTVDLKASPYNAVISAINFSGGSSLGFDGYGAPKQGGSLIVTVADRQHVISVDSSSGRVVIQ